MDYKTAHILCEEHVRKYVRFTHRINGSISFVDISIGRALENLIIQCYMYDPISKLRELTWEELVPYLHPGDCISPATKRPLIVIEEPHSEFNIRIRYTTTGWNTYRTHSMEFYLDEPED